MNEKKASTMKRNKFHSYLSFPKENNDLFARNKFSKAQS